jgi:drug/metabolite transporter superfamily protein YnfA
LGLLGLIAGFATWRWWARARGAHVVLLGGAIISMIAALATTNNFGGEAVGFRHAVYLAPAFLTMLLPWAVDGPNGVKPQTYAVIGVAALSCALMLVFAVPNPWSVLSVSHAPIGTWGQYMPMVGRVVRGTLFTP